MKAITEIDLHAYVDGQLDSARRAEVETYLAAHPKEAERVRAYQQQADALHALYDPVLNEPVPLALQQRRRSFALKPLGVAAAAAWMALGGLIGWSLRDTEPVVERVAFARQAALAHAVFSPEVRHPVEVGVDQEVHLVSWLSKRLGADLKAPRLAGEGYELLGGRLLPGGEGPVAQFMYQNGRGQRLTLYLRKDVAANRETAFSFAQEGKVAVFYWVDGPFGYALSGEVGKGELQRLAHAVYRQLND
ncbi:MAG: anti-sigma factor [Betaproteobacteria bacterium]|nr:anti-sigma factor [Betaproteobacteria bacterium]